MQKTSLISLLFVLILASCGESFKKGTQGLEYKIISGGKKGEKLRYGMYMQYHAANIYTDGKKDTVLSDSRDSYPAIGLIDSVIMPPEFYKILINAAKGDSVVIRIPTDTLIKKSQGNLPPFIKKGNYFLTTVKILNVFSTKGQADSAMNKEMELAKIAEEKRNAAQLKADDKIINEYFRKNNITAQKAPAGTYVVTEKQGEGMNIDTNVLVKANYTGRTLAGKVFDSNTDPAFSHVELLTVNMTNDMTLGGGVIKGWKDGLTLLKKGSKAKFYIPSSLAYGKKGAGSDIGPNSILVFDIEVVDVISKADAIAEQEAQRKKMMAEQKRITDSLELVRKKTDTSGKK